eukprot:1801240-Lingulodinium_polyedra.AAC.1
MLCADSCQCCQCPTQYVSHGVVVIATVTVRSSCSPAGQHACMSCQACGTRAIKQTGHLVGWHDSVQSAGT